jgi:hypothetical protein
MFGDMPGVGFHCSGLVHAYGAAGVLVVRR